MSIGLLQCVVIVIRFGMRRRDGLYGLVSDEQILREFRKKRSPQEICRRLVRRANRAGGTDNITAIVARFEREGHRPRRASPSDTVRLEPRSGS